MESKDTAPKATPKTTSETTSKSSSHNHRAHTADDVKTSKHATRYLILGIAIAIFNYLLYAILSNLIFKDNSLIWLSTLISTTISTFLAFLLHSKITWKERKITKSAKYKFFVWNLTGAFIIGPLLTQLFSFLTPLYEFTYNIFQTIHIPFSYEFTLTTGAFILTSIVTMILNFLFYDKFVFGKSKV